MSSRERSGATTIAGIKRSRIIFLLHRPRYNSPLPKRSALEDSDGTHCPDPGHCRGDHRSHPDPGQLFTVSTAQVAVVTRFGKFLRVAEAGLNWKMPYIDSVAGVVSLRVNQISLTMETKTKDNVFVTIPISVQNRVRPEKVYDAFYKLANPSQQIQSYVEQVILGHVPGMTLDEVFASQSSIAAAVKQELDA